MFTDSKTLIDLTGERGTFYCYAFGKHLVLKTSPVKNTPFIDVWFSCYEERDKFRLDHDIFEIDSNISDGL